GLWKLSMLGLPESAPIVRYAMYRRIRLLGRDLNCNGKVLSVSHSEFLCGELGIDRSQILAANYPQYDIASLPFPPASFDAVVSDQVLEHIPCDPQTAIDEVHRVLRPGGIAVHTTCFLTPYHGPLCYGGDGTGDYWRFTHQGLQYLHRRYSRVIESDGWGSPWMPLFNWLTLSGMPVPEADWHPLNWLARNNRPSYHYVVWVIAQK
ncbi:MAG: methyltransferase domain-containing protein, partial [Terriglobia bacterium]